MTKRFTDEAAAPPVHIQRMTTTSLTKTQVRLRTLRALVRPVMALAAFLIPYVIPGQNAAFTVAGVVALAFIVLAASTPATPLGKASLIALATPFGAAAAGHCDGLWRVAGFIGMTPVMASAAVLASLSVRFWIRADDMSDLYAKGHPAVTKLLG